MDAIDHTLINAASALRMAVPNPVLWQGSAASACAHSIENLAQQILALQQRISSWVI
ncbi:hypothetical protein [Rhodoluna sp.]|uniref:hypothetical protein n=1 Tax=Rhodoluna sp. TaxID=1969481 RepID=UPI0025F85B2E|nr:hypothetical protein [Rhodoluna sp.]